jgi:hypothetical protein
MQNIFPKTHIPIFSSSALVAMLLKFSDIGTVFAKEQGQT